MYRPSDSNCTGPDAAPKEEIDIPFKVKWDCLSPDASDLVGISICACLHTNHANT